MDLLGTSITGLASMSLTEIFSFTTAVNLVLITLIGILAAYIFPKIPSWFCKKINKLSFINFDEEVQGEASKVIRWIVYISVLYSALYAVGFVKIYENPLFQLVLLLFAMKAIISALKPSLRKLDAAIKGVKVHEGSIMEKIVVTSIYIIGLFAALSVIGVGGALTAGLAGAGVMGIVIGFGAKDLVSNTLSGIFIAIDKPFVVGDIIEIKGEAGTVVDMGLRTTRIRKFDNRMVTVPNASLANNLLINYTANKLRRVSIEVGINYSSDMEKSIKTFKEALESIGSSAKGKEPQVLISEFGDSAIELEGRIWINQRKHSFVEEASKAKEAVIEHFRKNEVGIPFPTRVIIQK